MLGSQLVQDPRQHLSDHWGWRWNEASGRPVYNSKYTQHYTMYTVYSIQYAVYSALTFLFRPAGDSEGVGGQAGLHLQD